MATGFTEGRLSIVLHGQSEELLGALGLEHSQTGEHTNTPFKPQDSERNMGLAMFGDMTCDPSYGRGRERGITSSRLVWAT